MKDDVRKRKNSIIIGALLHDIGKFYRRTGIKESHEKCGTEAIDKNFTSKARNFIDWGLVKRCIEEHHSDSATDEPFIVQIADRLSAGEREEKKEEGKPGKEPLLSIFSILAKGEEYGYKLRELKTDYNIFPEKYEIKDLEKDYSNLWSKFIEEVKNLPDFSFEVYFTSLYHLLLKYTTFIPSAVYKSEADISLFDHLKTTAGIASVLIREEEKRNKFLLVIGDISGIQKFIYTISIKKAAKGLRGRSFYLELLSYSIAREILYKTGYTEVNLLYNGGGKFTLLVDNNSKEKIEEIIREINRRFLKEYNGSIYIAVGFKEFDYTRTDPSRVKFEPELKEVWKEAMEETNRRKRQKYIDLNYQEIFEPDDRIKVCEVCRNYVDELYLEEDMEVCKICKEIFDIGKGLPYSEYIIERRIEGKENGFIIFPGIGYGYKIIKESELKPERLKEGDIIYRINNTEFMEKFIGGRYGYGIMFIGGKEAPKEGDGVKTFEEIAKDKEGGIERIGILRMDIDSLGDAFKKVLEMGGISRIVFFSRLLELFFCGYLNFVVSSNERYRDGIYITYAGGDDVFVVGQWKVLIDFTLKIYKDFRRYICNWLTLSAGMVILRSDFPIYKGAEISGDMEDEAKRFEHKDGRRKNAITVGGKTLSWNDFEIAYNMAKDIAMIIEANERARSIIGKLWNIVMLYRKNRTEAGDIEEMIRYNQWRWRLVYTLGRYIKETEIKEEVNEIKNAILINKYKQKESEEEIIKYLDLITGIAELLTRKGGNKNE